MYIFEFTFQFDQDDLSYMWQNLAPRNYKTFSFDYAEVGHELLTTELLSGTNLADNENLRWMVFKVKQKSQVDYYDLITSQAGKLPSARSNSDESGTGYNISYNWPYDFVSMIERIKIDAEILYSNESYAERLMTDTPNTYGLPQEAAAGGAPATPMTAVDTTVGVDRRELATQVGYGGVLDQTSTAVLGRTGYKVATGVSTDLTNANPVLPSGPVLSEEALNRLKDK